jgi:hypothetical protein
MSFPQDIIHRSSWILEYTLGLIGLHTYNSIPNIDVGNNEFYYDGDKKITIPPGVYEISDIETFLQNALAGEGASENEKKTAISLKPNNNTLKCEIISSFSIDFTQRDSIGRMLGFSARLLSANTKYESDLPVNIIKVVTIRVDSNITTASYYDTRLSHTLFEFAPSVQPGYSMNIEPRNIIYLPINTTRIDNISLRLVDQSGDPVNFRGEQIVIRLELKRLSTRWD